MSPLGFVLGALRAAQAALEARQSAAFGLDGKGIGMVAAGLCPLHGPVVKLSVAELVRQYR